MAVLGWSGPALTLAEAAELAGVSRETVRRDRDRVAARLASSDDARQVAAQVTDLTREAGDDSGDALAQRALERGIVAEASGLAPVLATLTAARMAHAVHLAAAGELHVIGERAGAARAAQEDLTNGLPYRASGPELTAALADLVSGGAARWLRTGAESWASLPAHQVTDSPGGRALRRVLTMTGPLMWADLLAAWARAGGRAPHQPLPPRVDVLDAWVTGVPGLALDAPGGPVRAAHPPVELDRTSQVLLDALTTSPGGLGRAELLAAAESRGLRRSGVAAALSYHPALVAPARGRWALRGTAAASPGVAAAAAIPAVARRRPTTFAWAPGGQLVLEFTVPSGPSPVVAVPSVVAEVLAGHTLTVRTASGGPAGEMRVRDARAWGFGPALARLGLRPGDRAVLTCDVLAGAVTVTGVPPKEGTPR